MAVETSPLEALRNGIGERLRSGFPMLPLPTFLRKDVSLVAGAVPDTESEDITDPFKTLEGLDVKTVLMQGMVDHDEVFQPAIGRVRFVVKDLVIKNLVSNGGIEGIDNLHWAIAWARAQNKGMRFFGAHEADADHMVLVYLLEEAGFKIQDELTFLAGVNMQKRPSVKRLTRCADVIYNVTPRDAHHLQELLSRKDEFGFNEEQIERLEEIKRTFSLMNRRSGRALVEQCVRGRKPLVAYIEGGRSYDGYLRPSQEEFSAIIPKDDSVVIVPYRLYGPRELNPPGKDPKILNYHLIPGFRQKVRMVVGEPYLSSEVWEVHKARTEEARGADGSKINPMEWPMANIVNLDQHFARPEELPHYADLMARFAPQRNRIIVPDEKGHLSSRVNGQDYPILRYTYPDNWIHTLGRKLFGFYLRVWHDFSVQLDPTMPKEGPVLFLTNHDSHLTTIALMIADPYYPWTTVPVKSEFSRIPGVKQFLDAWKVKYVNRDGEDSKVARELLHILSEGRTVCIAAEGTRSRDGRLQPMDSSLVALTLIAAKRGYPVVPIGVLGTFDALPPGRWFPGPAHISVTAGKPMDLSQFVSQKATAALKIEAAKYMQDQLAALLPPGQRPAPGTPAMWEKKDYLKPRIIRQEKSWGANTKPPLG